MDKKTKELSREQKLQNNISGFFESNSKLLMICGIVVIAVVLAIVITTSVVTRSRDNAMIRIQDLEEKVTNFSVLSDEDKAGVISGLAAEEKGKGYVSIKASYLKGVAYYINEDWQNAYDSFMACIDKDDDGYLTPLALVNAAACQESLGNTSAAIELYTRVGKYDVSGVGAKALFNTGRIYYEQGNTQLAKSVFEQLKDKYPSSEYSALASNLLVMM